MSRKVTHIFFIAAVFFGLQFPIFAQGWERVFGYAQNDGLADVVNTADGGYAAVGVRQMDSLDRDILLIKTDADGNQQWSRSIGHNMYLDFGASLQATPDGGYVIGGTSIGDGNSYAYIVKTNTFGDTLWTVRSSQDSVQGRQVIQLSDGGFAIIGLKLNPPVPNVTEGQNFEVFLMKVGSDGLEKWWKTFGGSNSDEGFGLVEMNNGDLILAGKTNSFNAEHYDIFIVKTNATGDQLWASHYDKGAAELAFAIAPCTNGEFVLAGQIEDSGATGEDGFLFKIDASGNETLWKRIELPGLETIRSVRQTVSGGFILAGESRINDAAQRQVLLIKTLADGSLEWKKEFGGVMGDGGNAVIVAPNGGFVVAGFTHSFGAGGSDGYLIRTDGSGFSLTNFIQGNVYSNLNATCQPESFGQDIANYLVEITGPFTYYGTTDENGRYWVPVPDGTYNVHLINPSPYWEPCQDSVTVSLAGVFDTATVDFSLHSNTVCPLMEVDLSTLGLRRCFSNAYSVRYRNLGSEVANPALIEVNLDPFLNVDSTSIPWVSSNSNNYVFNVGLVAPFQEGEFQVYLTVNCDSTVLGQTHCSEAQISPAQLCLPPDPNWDEASISLEAKCENDSVIFTLRNQGDGNMAEPLNLIVIEDVFIGFQANYQLESHQSATYSFPANGSTWRMEADQSPGHPGNSKPSVAVEGCGAAPFSTGYIVQYPLNDADLSVDMDCRENTGSYDPNDKQGFPTGYGAEHFIERNTDIEYLIRFQNTGTDTAFTVIIRDTLSAFLDKHSIEIGAASHPCRWELYGNGIVKFTFDNIMLPDSNINEPASHGFVKFRIGQLHNNAIGTKIRNRAGIYFDFNAPILTNRTLHTIGENFILLDSVSSAGPGVQQPMPTVKVYPNPFVETATFELENVQGNSFTFSLFDANGREVRHAERQHGKFEFHREGLQGGIYYFRISDSGGQSYSGKIFLK
ncbi:MAG: T9SS type A sorting domain-containing protein [Saprospiraceae bacterium]